jgi:hypothetical protein
MAGRKGWQRRKMKVQPLSFFYQISKGALFEPYLFVQIDSYLMDEEFIDGLQSTLNPARKSNLCFSFWHTFLLGR